MTTERDSLQDSVNGLEAELEAIREDNESVLKKYRKYKKKLRKLQALAGIMRGSESSD